MLGKSYAAIDCPRNPENVFMCFVQPRIARTVLSMGIFRNCLALCPRVGRMKNQLAGI